MARSLRDFRDLSLWWDSVGENGQCLPPLDGDVDVDVAIVGGGFTGLWTARSLLEEDPALRVIILESETCGFGASGRNGGWASALFAASDAKLARTHGSAKAEAMRVAMRDAVDQIGLSAKADGIDCEYAKGGTVVAARSAAELARARRDVEDARSLGIGEGDLALLDQEAAIAHCAMSDVLGATFTPHCAAINPAKLVRGLARSVAARGARICEQTRAIRIVEGSGTSRPQVITPFGTVRADVVVRATEGWTATLPGTERDVIPIYSLMIATEPLPSPFFDEVGLAHRETFADHRHLVIYGQRTADNRIAFGGRGAPYHYGSAIEESFDKNDDVFRLLAQTLVELFPQLRGTAITHSWGGPLGVPRDWYSSVGLDTATGIAWAGGYVGDGVTTTNLAGRTLADLICGVDSDLVALPWVNHRSPKWEPEPLRWLGVNAGLAATKWSDRSERKRGKPSWLAAQLEGLLGG